MATKRNKKPSKKVKTLRARSLSAKQAKSVRGGGHKKPKEVLPEGKPYLPFDYKTVFTT